MKARRSAIGRKLPWILLACIPLSCTETEDYLGYDRPSPSDPEGRVTTTLGPLACPSSYPSAFRDVLGRTQAEIDARIAAAYAQLFHGSSDQQSIYFATGSDQASIRDILHNNEVRSEGMGLGMLISVMLDKRDEFDRLWRYTTSNLEHTTGPLRGYFRSHCDMYPVITSVTTWECLDPYGFEQFVMALLLARQRWGGLEVTIDYGSQAVRLFDVMRNKEYDNRLLMNSTAGAGAGGAAGSSGIAGAGGTSPSYPYGVANTFERTTKLVFDDPAWPGHTVTGTSLENPGYFTVWAQVTNDAFYAQAAQVARTFLRSVAHPVTGLIPVRANFDATPAEGWEGFSAEAYRALLNMVVDRIWGTPDKWQDPQLDALLAFFLSRGLDSYGAAYSLDGATTLVTDKLPEMIMVNAVVASISNLSTEEKRQFLQDAWDQVVPFGTYRYYPGLIYLLSYLILGGHFRLCP